MFFIEAVGPAKETAGSEGPTILDISAIEKGLSGQVLVPGVVIDNRYGTFASEVVVVVCNVVFLPR